MTSEGSQPVGSRRAGKFRIEGQIQREQTEAQPGELRLAAYVFDRAGALLGSAELDAEGKYSVAVGLTQPSDVELVVGPVGDAENVRHSSAYRKGFSAEDWEGERTRFRLEHDALLSLSTWLPLWPLRICVSGHVRKVSEEDGVTDVCPVPFVKVEVFDVDREPCWWPWLRKWWVVLLDRPVMRIPELLKEPPFPPQPLPGPDPVPDLQPGPIPRLRSASFLTPLVKRGINPQPEPPRLARGLVDAGAESALNPEPEMPSSAGLQEGFTRVGEARAMDSNIAARLGKLTLTSKIAPWFIFPHCFHSKALVCETKTDCDGEFVCCFDWLPYHFRRGRLRFDLRPDIVIRVTQVINGVSTVIYMDPYTSTRWNGPYADIDLYLDNEDVVCGSGQCYQPPAGSAVFFTRIGSKDEVYQINQATGLWNSGSHTNVAYGGRLHVHGQFGDDLTRSDPAHGDPPPYYYYRLSYAQQGSGDDGFTFIDVNLTDTRVDKTTLTGETHDLGPHTVNGAPSLYEVRNFADYYWYNPDWIGTWRSWLAEEDTGTYILRLELFDKNGTKLDTASGTVDYRNGAGAGNGTAPAPLPPMVDHCDLVITLDNKRPKVELTIPEVINDCGVVPWGAVPPLELHVNASQENNRLHSWSLWYTKGVGSEQLLDAVTSSNGLPGSYTGFPVDGAPLLAGLTTTCAFALRLRAEAHIRNGQAFIYDDQDIDAIVIEKSSP